MQLNYECRNVRYWKWKWLGSAVDPHITSKTYSASPLTLLNLFLLILLIFISYVSTNTTSPPPHVLSTSQFFILFGLHLKVKSVALGWIPSPYRKEVPLPAEATLNFLTLFLIHTSSPHFLVLFVISISIQSLPSLSQCSFIVLWYIYIPSFIISIYSFFIIEYSYLGNDCLNHSILEFWMHLFSALFFYYIHITHLSD
jgi:hypothetical protein